MDSSRFGILVDLLGDAMERPASEREAFLVERCEDEELLQEARSLLAQAEATSMAAVTAELEARIDKAAADTVREPQSSPERIGPYRILDVLGAGGMGVIYRARQESPISREVALKVIRAGIAGPQVVARFESERQALALMDHPSIARVYDAGATPDGLPYFVMELVSGTPITSFCDGRRAGIRERLRLFADICRAVQHAHQKGIIHRDLKPANVLVTEVDGKPVPKVIDFGIAKATEYEQTAATLLTEEGMIVGTLEYMSPEQASLAAADIDTRSDVYSLGVMLYELVVGRLPFDTEALRGVSLIEVQRILRDTDPPRPSQRIALADRETSGIAAARSTDQHTLRRLVRRDLDWVIMRALEKDPDRRYQNASDLAEELERVLRDEPVEAGPPSLRYRAIKFVRRHRIGVATAALVALALLIGAVSTTAGFIRATATQRVAEREAARAQMVNEFLTDMLSSVRPDRARGEEVTVLDVLNDAAARIDSAQSFADDPEVEATVRHTIGDSYQALGEYDRALPFLERALELRREAFGPDDERVAATLGRLGEVHWLRGDLAASLPYGEEVLALRERTVGQTHPEYSAALMNLGNTYADLGQYARAEELLRRSLAIDREVLVGDDREDLAFTLNNLATVLADQKKFDEAVELHRESLALRREFFGEDSPSVAICLSNLGFALEGTGELAAAESVLIEAVELAELVFGPDHPRTAPAWTRLASVLEKTGQTADAEAYLRRAIAVFAASGGERSWRVGGVRMQLGTLLAGSGRRSEAEAQLVAGWEILSEALGNESPRTRAGAASLADFYAEARDDTRAAVWRQRAQADTSQSD